MKQFIATSFVLFQFLFFAQEKQQSLSLLTNYHPSDFFIGVEYPLKKEKIEIDFGAQVGVNRTFFQSRLYPKIHTALSKNYQFSKKFGLYFSLRTASSFLNVSSDNKKSVVFTLEPTIGSGLQFGNQFKVYFLVYWGKTFFWRNTVSSTNNWTGQRLVSPEIKFSYAF